MGSEVEYLATQTVENGEPQKVPKFLEEISDKTYIASDEVLEDNAVQPCDVTNETSKETVDAKDTEPAKDCNPRMAALMAVHLVSEVLDEAYLIANDAQESGQPWKYLSTEKNANENNIDEPQLEESKGDNVNENNFETAANINATSTPQKNAARLIDCSEVTLTPSFNDSTLIGQGDEEIETQEDDTSMYINQLFNMSDVERVIFCGTDDTNVIQNLSEPNDFLNEAMNKIMDSYVANPFQSIEEYPAVMSSFISNPFHHLEEYTEEQYNDTNDNTPAEILSSDYSEYSFLSDAYVADIGRDVTFYIEEGPSIKDEVYESLRSDSAEETTEFKITEEDTFETGKTVIEQEKHNDFQLYENAYVTLNRDYDQCSEDDGYPILQDPKEMILQEVELMTSNTSDDEQKIPKATVSKKEEADVSALNGSRRSTLARRCRYQGAKLFACLRGWWRRKVPGNRKLLLLTLSIANTGFSAQGAPGLFATMNQIFRKTLAYTYNSRQKLHLYIGVPRYVKESKRAVLSVCPLSPDARRRASSLLDNRMLRSPSPSRPLVWKFNTVNEVIVNSNRWKDYTFSAMPEEQRGDNI